MIDTCQAATLYEGLASIPDVVSIGSSIRGESSYSLQVDEELGVTIIDRFTYYILRFLEANTSSNTSLLKLFKSFDRHKLHSTAHWHSTLDRSLDEVKLGEFLGAVLEVSPGNATLEDSISYSLSTTDSIREGRSVLKDEEVWGIVDSL